jgi:hypothetical protein
MLYAFFVVVGVVYLIAMVVGFIAGAVAGVNETLD